MNSLLWSRPANNFGLMRLVAAWLVLFSHSFHLVGMERAEPLMYLTGGLMTLGTLAVGVFFSVSGYLITASALARPKFGVFLLARVRRIFPALALVVLLSALVLGPCYTSMSIRDYFSTSATYTYVARNVTMVSLQYGLPGVFTANPYGAVVNGSLWTLPIEFSLYLLVGGGVLLLRYLGRVDSKILPLLVICAGCGLAWALWLRGIHAPVLLVVPYFLLGSLCRILRPRLHGAVATLLCVAALASVMFVPTVFPVMACFAISYCTLWLALHPRWIAPVNLDAIGDLSYGTYLFAFPVQQSLLASGLAQQPLALCSQASLIVMPLAWLCWHFVERRFVEAGTRQPLSAERVPG